MTTPPTLPPMLELPDAARPFLVHHGDCLELMPQLPANSIDAIVSDPPYGLAFMGRTWDHGVPGVPFWEAALRVAKPGAHLVAFGGTRTYHRLTCAIEDAGWEIRDSLMWLYGSGFPKSLDVGASFDKRRDDRARILEVTAWVRAQRDRAGVTNAQIDAAFGMNGMAGHWTSGASQPSIPTLEQIPTLLAVLGLALDEVPEAMRALIWELNGRKGTPGEAWFDREVVGHHDTPAPAQIMRYNLSGRDGKEPLAPKPITAAATELAREWADWGTALKPAWEPIILARKPLAGTVASTVERFGTGALNIEACRIGFASDADREKSHANGLGPVERFKSSRAIYEGGKQSAGFADTHNPSGRWPANVLLDPEAAAILDAQTGTLTSGANPTRRGAPKFRTAYGEFEGQEECTPARGVDSGGASRFFYTAKAARGEREAGLEGMELRAAGSLNMRTDAHAHGNETAAARNSHPTVKPIALMRWLAKLITPPSGTVLDPFTGSGSTGCGAVLEGFKFVGLEKSDTDDEPFVTIARRRIAHWHEVAKLPPSMREDMKRAEPKQPDTLDLFGAL